LGGHGITWCAVHQEPSIAHLFTELVGLVENLGVIWIEHIVHALVSVASRLIVLDFGQLIAEGEPRAVMADARVQEIYMGIPAS
jgi:branched-chain amino acid transport system ATP-binding protein